MKGRILTYHRLNQFDESVFHRSKCHQRRFDFSTNNNCHYDSILHCIHAILALFYQRHDF